MTSDSVRWRDIRVGDLVYVSNKQPLPADIVLLATSGEEHVCYIETSSIDGETNLKLRRAVGYMPPGAPASPDDVLAQLEEDCPTILCDLPNMKVESFTGTLNIPHASAAAAAGSRRSSHPRRESYDRVVPIDNDNVLLRGAVLRNTEWAVGVAVYTGKDSKLQVRVAVICATQHHNYQPIISTPPRTHAHHHPPPRPQFPTIDSATPARPRPRCPRSTCW